MFKVIHSFVDVVENRNYNVGDEFIVGPKTDEQRIAKLSGYDNNIKHPLIEAIDDAPVEDEPPVEDAPVEDEPPVEEPAEVQTEAEPEVVAQKPANKSKSASKGE